MQAEMTPAQIHQLLMDAVNFQHMLGDAEELQKAQGETNEKKRLEMKRKYADLRIVGHLYDDATPEEIEMAFEFSSNLFRMKFTRQIKLWAEKYGVTVIGFEPAKGKSE